jgi:hypothetical protein
MAYSVLSIEGSRTWVCDTITDLLLCAPIASIGDRAKLMSAEIELERKNVSTTNGFTKPRWVPIDTKRWGSNNITTAPPIGYVSDEGAWVITGDHFFTEAQLNRSYDCLSIEIYNPDSSVTLMGNSSNKPACLMIRAVYLKKSYYSYLATISMDGQGFVGASGGVTTGSSAAGPLTTRTSQFSICALGGGGGGGSYAGGNGGITTVGSEGSYSGNYWGDTIQTTPLGGAAHAAGQSAASMSPAIKMDAFENISMASNIPVGGGGGNAGSSGYYSTLGGSGGGCLIIQIAHIQSDDVTGITFSAKGGSGPNSPDTNVGGGGGGGGGYLRVLYRVKTGSVSADVSGGTGGLGGTGGGAGGNGAGGIYVVKTV